MSSPMYRCNKHGFDFPLGGVCQHCEDEAGAAPWNFIRGSLPPSALQVQEGGSHYKSLAIQPVEYIHANGIPFIEGSVIKYVTRWREKGGLEDLRKARHFLDILLDLETRATETAAREQ